MSLREINVQSDYDPDTCDDIIAEFYNPVLATAVRYDRTTYTFSMAGLAEAASGLAGLINSKGVIRLICDQEMDEATVRAILEGHADAATELLKRVPPEQLTAVSADDLRARHHLDLLTWLVKRNQMEIKVAIHAHIFHPKLATIADTAGDYIAVQGSINEGIGGWENNYESCDVYCSWKEPNRARRVQERFNVLWENRSRSARIIPVPQAYKEHLIKAAPRRNPTAPQSQPGLNRTEYWGRIKEALRNDPASTAATIPIALWPHQERLRASLAPQAYYRKLIADEVGLGKTIQAGVMLKTRLNQDPNRRCLVIAPKAALQQWQNELDHTMNITFPILERRGNQLELVYPDRSTERTLEQPWEHPHLIVSYQWLRNHTDELPHIQRYWGTIVADEAHHARPNTEYLKLLQHLTRHTEDLLLLTATPMQLDESELIALLQILAPQAPLNGLSQFYRDTMTTTAEWLGLRDAYREVFPETIPGELAYSENSMFVNSQIANGATRGESTSAMRSRYRREGLMSRNTREQLRQYGQPIATRQVQDIAIPMAPGMRGLYEEIDDLVRDSYRNSINSNALGFTMTVFRTRLSSSPHAYAKTLENLIARRKLTAHAIALEEIEDSEAWDEVELPQAANIYALRTAAAAAAETAKLDQKNATLLDTLDRLKRAGHRRIIIYTQFTDTQEYITRRLPKDNPILTLNGSHNAGQRQQTIALLRDSDQVILLATEAAGESLNLQYCSAVINYDIPWNPMRVEQRIGRIDRIGQRYEVIDIVNLFYEDTAEHDAYKAIRERLESIERNIGPYRAIIEAVAHHHIKNAYRNPNSKRDLRQRLEGLTLEKAPEIDWSAEQDGEKTKPISTMADLTEALTQNHLLPEGWKAINTGGNHWQLRRPRERPCTVTTDLEAYQYAQGQIKWWGPGNPAFESAKSHAGV